MPRILSKTTVDLVPGAVTRAPLGNLSCPYSSWDVLRQPDQNPGSDHAFRLGGTRDARRDDRSSDACADVQPGCVDPWHWCHTLATDYWNPPTSESQYARQRILAVIVAFILAAILAQAGW